MRDSLESVTLRLQDLRVVHNVETLEKFNSLSIDLQSELDYVEDSIVQTCDCVRRQVWIRHGIVLTVRYGW